MLASMAIRQTQHVLWRLQDGVLEGYSPKVIVVLAGTNNHDHSVELIVEALMEIVKTCRDKQPQATVILLGIPPCGQYDNPLRRKIASVNAGVASRVAGMKNVVMLDTDPSWFVSGSDASISHNDMYDYLHLTRSGYSKLAEPLLNLLVTHLKDCNIP